jgi:hypothetical protein
MPRGSKPGERRGGRQRGTPNPTGFRSDARAPANGRQRLTTGTASIARAAAFARNLWPAPSECASGSRSKPWRWGFSVVTNQLEQVLLHDRESERGNQLINPHAADLCLQEELSDRHLIKG